MANAAHHLFFIPTYTFLTRKSPTPRFTFSSRPPKRFAPQPRCPRMRRWVPKFGRCPRASGSGTGPVVQHLPLFQQRLLPVPCLHLTSGKPTVSEQRRQLCPTRGKIRLILLRDGDRDARGSTNSARGCDAGQTLPICSLPSARNRAQSKDAAFEMGVTNTRVSSTGWESRRAAGKQPGFFCPCVAKCCGEKGFAARSAPDTAARAPTEALAPSLHLAAELQVHHLFPQGASLPCLPSPSLRAGKARDA